MRAERSALVMAMIALAVSPCACADCGRLANDDSGTDGESDAQTKPCTSGAFGPPTALAELNTQDDERGLRFTPDELYGVFSRTKDSDAQYKPLDILATTRNNRATPLGAPVPAASTTIFSPGYVQLYPSITRDYWLRFESLCHDDIRPGEAPLCIYVPEDAGVWTDTGFIFNIDIAGSAYGFGPFGAGFSTGDGYVTSDASAYYFTGFTNSDGGLWQGIYPGPEAGIVGQAVFVTRPYPDYPPYDDASYPPPDFATDPVRLTTDPLIIDNPVLTEDELTMYASATTATDPVPHVYMATRSTTNDAFGAFTAIHELDSPEGEYPSWISPDRCRLYLTRRVAGQWDLFIASRQPQ